MKTSAMMRCPKCQKTSELDNLHLLDRSFKREFVGLTDEQIDACWNKDLWKEKQPHHIFARAIEAKLKQKNGYAEEKNT